MQKITVSENEAGQRLDKLLGKYLSEAPKNFLYKMLRKKNIKLNGKKAQGNETLVLGDEITLFLAEDTIKKFSGNKKESFADLVRVSKNKVCLNIIYEDKHVILVDKPAGMLSQKAAVSDISLNEHLVTYLLQSKQLTQDELKRFSPAVCNRLDRNTSGIICAGKTLPALQQFGEMFRMRSMEKYYLTIVCGKVEQESYVSGFLTKDPKNNKVRICKTSQGNDKRIETSYRPLAYGEHITLLKVHLITGRTHQIRAHLALAGHPIIGDYKYGKLYRNEYFKKKYGLKSQLLHAWRMEFPKCQDALLGLSEKTIVAPLPPMMTAILKGEKILWQPGTQED